MFTGRFEDGSNVFDSPARTGVTGVLSGAFNWSWRKFGVLLLYAIGVFDINFEARSIVFGTYWLFLSSATVFIGC